MVAIIGDDQLFVKPTAGGRAFVGEIEEASPYPGAKPCFRILEEKWEDRQWLSKLVKISAAELPLPKPKAKKKAAAKRS
jgi:hypothetical protein